MPAQLTLGLERLCADVEAAAALAGASFSREVTHNVLKAYQRFFTRSAVSFRTSTRRPEKRELNVRFVELETPEDPHAVALSEGLLHRSGHPIDDLIEQVQRNVPILGYGMDFGVAYGVEKIWPFFPHRPQPLEVLRSLPSLPQSVQAHTGFLVEHDLTDVSLFALDYRSRSVNLYFMCRPGHFSTAQLAELIGALGFEHPGEELLEHCTRAVPIYFTFRWDRPRVERVCFGIIAPEPALPPTHLHPVIDRFVSGVPFATERRNFIYSVTLSREETFIKVENDYSGTMTALMQVF